MGHITSFALAVMGVAIMIAAIAKWVVPLGNWLPVFVVVGAILSAVGGLAVFRRFEAALMGFLIGGPISLAFLSWARETLSNVK